MTETSKRKPIRKAVFPVAGLGTRFLPATKAIPKEMLPIIDRPLIQYAVDEAREAGIEQLIFVTGRGKTAIVEHFDTAYELEAMGMPSAQDRSVCWSRRASSRAIWSPCASRCRWAWATRSGARAHCGDEPFAIFLPDELMIGSPAA
jgi:UTP--glucose-1-phosphate uridylyltransferase